MNKIKIIKNYLPKTLRHAEQWMIEEQPYSAEDIKTFKRFINALPNDLINPKIYNPTEGIGVSFQWYYNTANLAIRENKIYVEKLDEDHLCRTRDEWFSYKPGEKIPEVILKFLEKNYSLNKIGIENYLNKRRDSIKTGIQLQRLFDKKTKDMNFMQKLGEAMAGPVRCNLDYTKSKGD